MVVSGVGSNHHLKIETRGARTPTAQPVRHMHQNKYPDTGKAPLRLISRRRDLEHGAETPQRPHMQTSPAQPPVSIIAACTHRPAKQARKQPCLSWLQHTAPSCTCLLCRKLMCPSLPCPDLMLLMLCSLTGLELCRKLHPACWRCRRHRPVCWVLVWLGVFAGSASRNAGHCEGLCANQAVCWLWVHCTLTRILLFTHTLMRSKTGSKTLL